ncbi:hypothetical protein TPHA_0G02130 [Tetrapisispora phaffii CBS 4417]|uniref:GATA-type domain-containing protein n=1 Tax=Tetrapisispora phaffii (strain ATCC 24235 / CBS 4417 / NBRC 1672 / NRRL Y-8282 / UCD 70-5) TaxID=1071381 RepID=G8BVX1_TETPH|nr:hypothetical protein TPHA_0G02130 [Tetrapisispora phaffii CBS 4417]CCE64049.1 hypothetical protein TPHA_0G02130 [Tetrapisispora phaffii CBS 4417]
MSTPKIKTISIANPDYTPNNKLIFKNNIQSNYFDNNHIHNNNDIQNNTSKSLIADLQTSRDFTDLKNETLFSNTQKNYKLTTSNNINKLLNIRSNSVYTSAQNNFSMRESEVNQNGHRQIEPNSSSQINTDNVFSRGPQQRKNSLDSLIKATQSVEKNYDSKLLSSKNNDTTSFPVEQPNNIANNSVNDSEQLYKISFNPTVIDKTADANNINHTYREKISRLVQAHQIFNDDIQSFPLYKQLESTFPYLPNLLTYDAKTLDDSIIDSLSYEQLLSISQSYNNFRSIFDEIIQLKKEKSKNNDAYSLPTLPRQLTQASTFSNAQNGQNGSLSQSYSYNAVRRKTDPATTVLPSIGSLTNYRGLLNSRSETDISGNILDTKAYNQSRPVTLNDRQVYSNHKKSNSDPIDTSIYSPTTQLPNRNQNIDNVNYAVKKPAIRAGTNSITKGGKLSNIVNTNIPSQHSYGVNNPRTFVINSIINPQPIEGHHYQQPQVQRTQHNNQTVPQQQYSQFYRPHTSGGSSYSSNVGIGANASYNIPGAVATDTISKQHSATPDATSSDQGSSNGTRHNSVTEELLIAESMRKNEITKMACVHCNDHDTPEWRKGPYGNRTLCNACGLFYRKLIKKFGLKSANLVMRYRKNISPHDRRVPSGLSNIPESHIKVLNSDKTLDDDYNTIP